MCIIEIIRINNMLPNSAIILIGLWLLGLITAYTLDGLIHVLLVIAILISAVSLVHGKRVL